MKKILIVLLLFSQVLFAQRSAEYTSKNPKAVRLFEAALQMYDGGHDEKALEQITDVLAVDSTFVEAYLLRANISQDLGKNAEAIEAYESSLRFLPDFFPNTYLTLGKLYFAQERYQAGKKSFDKFLTYKGTNPILQGEARRGSLNCVFADSAVKNPVPFDPVNLGDAINSAAEEYMPAITADGNTFLYTRRSKVVSPGGREYEEENFFISHRKDGKWQPSVPMDDINTTGNEGAPALSSDGNYLFFVACANMDGRYPGEKTGQGRCDIFLSRRDGEHWGKARNLEMPVNTSEWESMPSFSSDGRTLYFVRKVKDKNGKDNADILVSHIGDDSKWSTPVSVSDKINTPYQEMFVFIHPDDQTLYFSSNGLTGMGGFDLYMSRRQPDGSWGDPVNMGYPLNTGADENSLLISPDGETGFFASNRSDSRGGLDIYQFSLAKNMRPQPVTYMKGRVMEADSRKPLPANFELIDLATGKTAIRSNSDATTGEFLIALPSGKRYALNVSNKDYLFYSENFELKEPASAKEPFLKDVLLHPVRAGESIVLKNIFFDTDSFRLKPESAPELDRLVSFLKSHAGVKVEVSGHTDNVGDKKYNQGLSEKRAKSVYDYLAGAGIDAARLTFKGYGDTKPVASNNSDAGKAQNRRTEFTILSAP